MEQSSLSLYKLQKEFSELAEKKPIVPVSITLEDGTTYEHQGQLEFIDTQVSSSTGSVTLRALIPNPEHTLLSGMYVRAHIASPEERNYLVVPQSAVVRSQSGEPSIFIVDENNKTVKKSVVLGNEVNNQWVVKEGLALGDKVVINNLTKVKSNQTVVIDSEVTTSNSSETNSQVVE
jgi:membrane fusion protein (multidrug efflux system)